MYDNDWLYQKKKEIKDDEKLSVQMSGDVVRMSMMERENKFTQISFCLSSYRHEWRTVQRGQ